MNLHYRKVIVAIVTTFAALALPARAQSGPDIRVARLDAIVHLTADQKANVAAIFEREQTSVQQANAEGRPMFPLFAATQNAIRAQLTPDQRQVFDRTPVADGGGLTVTPPEVMLKQLDRQVGLNAAQKQVALQVYKEQYDALVAMSADEREAKGAHIYMVANDQIRALLTPDQVDKLDRSREALSSRDPQDVAAIDKAIRDSTALAAEVGTITDLQRLGRSNRVTKEGRSGQDRFRVTGDKGAAIVTVSWTRTPATDPLKILKITSAPEHDISP